MVYGTALLALCYLAGIVLGDLLGAALGVKTNVGGVGIAMLLLVFTRLFLQRAGRLLPTSEAGIHYWGAMYIPVVVAMAAQQDVVKALSGGWMAVLAAVATVLACAGLIAVINRTEPPPGEAQDASDPSLGE
jgi:malonate transporter MadL subunit